MVDENAVSVATIMEEHSKLTPADFVERAEILEKALAYVGEHGWHQGEYQNSTGAVCLDGALRAICTGSAFGLLLGVNNALSLWLDYRMAQVHPEFNCGDFRGAYIRFNDHYLTTEADVVEFIEAEAATLRALASVAAA